MAYFVITKTIFNDESVREEVLKMSRDSFAIFKRQPGLIEGKSLYAENKTHIATWLVWENKQAHLACMESKDFAAVTVDWTRFMKEGQIRFELETYELIA